jgi:hypothetical protein
MAFLLCLLPGTAALAGTIVGTIYDAETGLPLQHIDLDLFDTNFGPVYGIDDPGTPTDAVSAEDGTFSFEPIAAGAYYLRADPTQLQGFVVQYAPGVFLASEAVPVQVRETGTTTVDFYLEKGHWVRGRVVDAVTLEPVAGIDLDLYGHDQSFVDWINAHSDANGEFSLGLLPNGDYYIGADPPLSTMYLDGYSGDALQLDAASTLQLQGEDFVGLELRLQKGGALLGACEDASTGAFLSQVDLDLYDADGNFVHEINGETDATGAFGLGLLVPGTYFLKADASTEQGYVDTWFGNVQDQSLATPIVVTAGDLTSGLTIAMPLGGTVSGLVTNASTGEPLSDIQMSLYDEDGNRLAASKTQADGTYHVGAVLESNYVVRCAGIPEEGFPFQYHTGALLKADAEPVLVQAGSTTAHIDFPLMPGGWISGSLGTRMGDPYFDVDLDIYTVDGDYIPGIDDNTDASGAYRIGPLPAGQYLLFAKLPRESSCGERFYGGTDSYETATVIEVTSGGEITDIDFLCGGIERVVRPRQTHDLSATPNPFNPMTRIAFELDRSGPVRVTLHDVRGRIIATLVDGKMNAGHHEFLWDGRGVMGVGSSSGVHFVRLETARGVEKHKLILLK